MKRFTIIILGLIMITVLTGEETKDFSNIKPGEHPSPYSSVFDPQAKSHTSSIIPQPLRVDNDSNELVMEGEYNLYSDVYIRKGYTLRIMPGTKVIARQNYGIFIAEGAILKAMGEKGKEILFTANYDNDERYGEFLSENKSECWKGIEFASGEKGYNHLKYCTFSHCISIAAKPIGNQNTLDPLIKIDNGSSVFFENCSFEHCKYSNIIIDSQLGKLTFRDCIFNNCQAIILTEDNVTKFENCSFTENERLFFDMSYTSTLFEDCVFSFCNNLRIGSKQQDLLLINRSSISNCIGNKGLIDVSVCDDFRINDSIISLGKSTFSNINILKSNALIKKSLIKAYTKSSIDIDSDNYSQKQTAFLNTEIECETEEYIELGSNVDLYIFNTIFPPENNPAIYMSKDSRKNRITAYNNLFTQGFPMINEGEEIEGDFKDNIQYLSSNQAQHAQRYNERIVEDKGLAAFDNGIFKFYYPAGEYRGSAPDIGRIEKETLKSLSSKLDMIKRASSTKLRK